MRKLLEITRAPLVLLCLALAAGVAGCAGANTTAASVGGSTLKVYVGQASAGSSSQQAQDVLGAEQLALQQGGSKVGRFNVELRPLSGGKVSDQARTAISDSSTIAYLGELQPHVSADSLGITNGAGILQVSPNDPAIELTQTSKAVSNSPTRYYESLKTYGRTFGRVVPPANREASAQAQAMAALGVKRVYVADDGGPYGAALALALGGAAAGKGVAVTQGPADPTRVQASGADAAFIAANDLTTASRFLNGVAAASPALKLFGPSALNQAAFVTGLAPAAQRSLQVSAPGFIASGPKADLAPAGQKFVADFKAAYGHEPAQAAIFGYEAMAVVLDSLHRAAASANSRSAVVTEFMRTKQRSSVLGTYSIDGNGDPTLAPYVISHVRAGRLVPYESLQG